MKEFKGDLKAFEQLAKSSIGTFNLELENLSTKSRITRYQALETQLKAVMENLTGKTEKMIQDTAGKVCEDSFYKTLFDVDQYRGFHEDFVGLDENLIREIISQPVAGATFSQSIWRNQQNLNYRVRQTLTDAMATGGNPYELSKEFAKEFNVGRYEAYRLLYTESAAVHTDAQMRAYKADGVTRYEIVATLDSKTSKICQEMDGKQFDVDGYQKGENCPPFHPWCRTTTAPVIEELEDVGTRAARNKTTGKTEKVPAGMKYKDWKETYITSKEKYSASDRDRIFSTVTNDMLKPALEGINQLNEKIEEVFPGALQYLDSLEFYDDEPMSLLQLTKNDTFLKIMLNESDWADIEKMAEFVRQQGASGEHIKTSDPYALVAHELGHHLVNVISLKASKYNGVGRMNPIQLKIFERKKQKIYADIERILFFDISGDAEKSSLVRKELSKRADDSISELIAESVSQYFCGENVSRTALTVIEYLRKIW